MFGCANRDEIDTRFILWMDGSYLILLLILLIEMVNGLAVVEKDGKIGVLKKTGTFSIDFTDAKYIFRRWRLYHNKWRQDY